MYIETHAHLFFKDFQDDIDEVIRRAQDAGIEYIVNPGTDLETSEKSIELAEKYEMVYACVGFHPHDASKADDSSLKEIEKLSHHLKVVGIGEIGLDYHYNYSPPEKQREVFARQIEIAQRRNLPFVIHSREAEEDTLRIVERYVVGDQRSEVSHATADSPKAKGRKGVFHCFPGDVAMAKKVIDWGFYISIPGPVTFASKPTKPNIMAEVVAQISLEHILLETDSPFLTPIPFRGKRNEPSHIPIIAKKIAELRGCSVEEVGQVSTLSAKKLFGIGDKH